MGVLVTILIIVVICGALAWLVNNAPMLDANIKQIGVYAVIAVAIILVVLQLLPLLEQLASL